MLAGLPKAPSRLNPRTSPDLAAARAAEVLEAMVETGAITRPADGGRARGRCAAHGLAGPALGAGWFADWALDDLAERFPGNADLMLRPRSTRGCRRRPSSGWRRCWTARAARPACHPGRGGGARRRDRRGARHGRRAGLPRQPVQPRHPGAAPAGLRLQALRLPRRAGARAHAGRHRLRRADHAGRLVARATAAATSRAATSRFEDALALSVNTAAVRVLLRGRRARARRSRRRERLGLPGRFPNDASIALGTGEVTLLDLTAAYAPFANGGRRVAPCGIAAGTRRGPPVPAPAHAAPAQAIAPGDAADDAAHAGGGGGARHRPRRGAAGPRRDRRARPARRRTSATPGSSASPRRDGVLVMGSGSATTTRGRWTTSAAARLPARLFREILETAGN